MSTDKEIFYLVVNPPQTVAPSVIADAAALTGKSPFETRLLLAGKTPIIITQYGDKLNAEMVAAQLTDLGLNIIICRDTTLHQSSTIFTAQKLSFVADGVIFQDHNDRERRMEKSHLFLGIIGQADTATENSRTTKGLKFSPMATLLTGGIPIWRNVEEKTTERSVSHESFMRLYTADITAPVIEIRQREMNYAFLGNDIAPSSTINFALTVRRLRAAFPGAIFDDRLTDPAATPDGPAAQDMDISCRLIYLFELLAHGHPIEV